MSEAMTISEIHDNTAQVFFRVAQKYDYEIDSTPPSTDCATGVIIISDPNAREPTELIVYCKYREDHVEFRTDGADPGLLDIPIDPQLGPDSDYLGAVEEMVDEYLW